MRHKSKIISDTNLISKCHKSYVNELQFLNKNNFNVILKIKKKF